MVFNVLGVHIDFSAVHTRFMIMTLDRNYMQALSSIDWWKKNELLLYTDVYLSYL